MSTILERQPSWISLENAESAVAALNADPEDDWGYSVRAHPTDPNLAVVEVRDERGHLLGGL